MNNKGFTLVEIISVIVLLSLLIIVIGTKGFGAFDNSKKKIDEMNKEAIVEAAKLLAVDIENCDDEIDKNFVKNLIGYNDTCEKLINLYNNHQVPVSIYFMAQNEYLGSKNINEQNFSMYIYLSKGIDGNVLIKNWEGKTIDTENWDNFNWYGNWYE